MPREFLPPAHKREARTQALPQPAADRMLHREVVHDRRLTKQQLRQVATGAPTPRLQHIAD